jgi:uncharacterized membrane protein (DUF2068 family)
MLRSLGMAGISVSIFDEGAATMVENPNQEPTASRPPRGSANARRALRLIAAFEAVKGIGALAASIGLLSLLHHDLRHFVEELIGHFGLDPGARYPSMLLHEADVLQDANVRSLMLLATAYVSIRLVEAYGLWHNLAWGEMLGALSGALYIPFEMRHFMHRPALMAGLVIAGNAFIVGFLVYRLWRNRSATRTRRAP